MEATLTGTGRGKGRALANAGDFVTKADMRDRPRLSTRGIVTVLWSDEKRQIRYMRSIVRNISGGGALVLSYRPLPVGAFVRIRATNLYFLAGSGRVRHCKRWGFVYLIGLKFDMEMAARF